MSIDRELLEMAAKAVNMGPVLCYEAARNCLRIGSRKSYRLWRPLSDDGDALRLAVAGKMICGFIEPNCWAERPGVYPSWEPTDYRRAIVRAAAEIGRATTTNNAKDSP